MQKKHIKVGKLTFCQSSNCQEMIQGINIATKTHSNFLQSFINQFAPPPLVPWDFLE